MDLNLHIIAVDNAFAKTEDLDVAALLAAASGRHDEATLWTLAEYLDWVASEGHVPCLTTLRCTQALRRALQRCSLDVALKLAVMSPTVHGMVGVEEPLLMACA